MTLHYRAQPLAQGFNSIVARPQSGLRWLSLDRLHLPSPGMSATLVTGEEEAGIGLLSGTCRLSILSPEGRLDVESCGGRATPFEGPPTAIYVPRASTVHVMSLESPLEAAIYRAPSRRDTAPRFIPPAETANESFGRDNYRRSVYLLIGPGVDADRIVMGETHTPSGNWSSYPPHKHDADRPPESPSEEIYHFLLEPSFGFALQHVWTQADAAGPPLEKAFAVHHGDTVLIPRGYHPTVVAPGFTMVTLWAYAGEARGWRAWSAEESFARLLGQDAAAQD